MNQSTPSTATDPVCGMTIDPVRAVGSSSYNGKTYSFCSRGCEARFDAAPAQYASNDAERTAEASCCSAIAEVAAAPPCCST